MAGGGRQGEWGGDRRSRRRRQGRVMRANVGVEDGGGVDLAADRKASRALFEAADDDSATGGPDLIRGIFPIVATIDGDGFNRLDDSDIRQRFEALLGTFSSSQSAGPGHEPGDDA